MPPFMDMTDALLDPEIASTFAVVRRMQTITVHGRTQISVVPYAGIVGVVTFASPGDLERLDDNDRMGRHISIVTRFKLRGPSRDRGEPDGKPDQIVWLGNTYQIKMIEPYPQMGAGFVQAIAGSIDAIETPP